MRKRSEAGKPEVVPSAAAIAMMDDHVRGMHEKRNLLVEKSVEEISAELKESLDPKTPEEEVWNQTRQRREHAPDEVRPDLAMIVKSIFVVDMHKTWRRLRRKLRIGEKRSDYATIRKALDEAEHDAQQAHRLYVTAKVERDRWEMNQEVSSTAMWSKATRTLQEEKDSKLRNKAITDADVRARCAALFPDEWRHLEDQRSRLKETVSNFQNLAELWQSRCHTLRTMLDKLR